MTRPLPEPEEFSEVQSRYLMSDHVIVPVLMKIADQFGDTCVYEFHAAQLPDIGFYHQGIHPSDTRVYPHHPGCCISKAGHTIMIQVNSMDLFVVITPATEPGKAFVTEWLFFKTCGMECQLEAGIEHQVVDHFVIRITKKHFDDLGSNDHIERRVRSESLIGIKDLETFLVNAWKDVF